MGNHLFFIARICLPISTANLKIENSNIHIQYVKNETKYMGIKNLNKYLYEKCGKTSISKKHLSEISGKTIVIDTSIYLYQFLWQDQLNETTIHFF